jgi:hypothetical protein
MENDEEIILQKIDNHLFNGEEKGYLDDLFSENKSE